MPFQLPTVSPFQQAILTLLLWFVLAYLVDLFLRRVVMRLLKKTVTTLDEQVLAELRAPTAFTVLLFGIEPTLRVLAPDAEWLHNIESVVMSIGVVLWSVALYRIAGKVLDHGAASVGTFQLINARTLPLFDLSLKAIILGASLYWLMIAWDIDPTGWLASAGIFGIAIGFAAQETLGNLFAGIFIVTDAPYQLGDFLVLGDGTRGRVTDIGLRSTRLITNDGVEVTLPNREMASARITNESGGSSPMSRVRAVVEVAYGTDLEHARRVLLAAAATVAHFEQDDPERPPIVRWRSFNASGIEAEIVGWVPLPENREWALDALVVAVHAALNDAGIDIPYSTHVVQLVGPLPDSTPG